MTLLLPDTAVDPAADAIAGAPLSQRAVARAGDWLARRRPDRGRRSFLQRAALVGTALAVNPFDFIVRPQSAYATICGPANECSQGWTAFCCTVNGGANTCPDGSYAAGWWKVSSSAFCRGEDRYIVDCNRTPGATCQCRCATGECDRRRVCCNNFRYGQCNQQIPGTTEVVCRIIICTPPWEWDETCTTTVRSDERTRDHSSSCLPGPNPTEIEIAYQDLGLVGSVLGVPTGEERPGPAAGSWRPYANGVITRVDAYGLIALAGAAGVRYAQLGGPDGPLGWLTGEATTTTSPTGVVGRVVPAEGGSLYDREGGPAAALTGALHDAYNAEGGPAGWLGFPEGDPGQAPGGRTRIDFAAGWSLVLVPATGEVRLVPRDVELPADGSWPEGAAVVRWSGDDRIATAVDVSARTRDRAPMAVLAAADAFADALAGGVLAAIEGGPVLLTGRDGLAPATADELRRLDVDRVVMVGGPGALSAQVAADVESALPGADVERLAGDSRFATAAAIAAAVAPEGADVVYLASGREWADALAASPAAAREGAPLLLAEPTQLPPETAEALRQLSPATVVVVGGTAALSDAVATAAGNAARAEVERIAGASRYDTAAALAERSHPGGAETVLVATGASFADALAAGAAAAAADAPLLLVGGDQAVPRVTRTQVERLQPARVVVIGGEAAVAGHVARQLAAIPTEGYTTRA